MVNNKIRLIIFFAAKDEEALYSQQKQEGELTVTQIMNSLLPNLFYAMNLIPIDWYIYYCGQDLGHTWMV